MNVNAPGKLVLAQGDTKVNVLDPSTPPEGTRTLIWVEFTTVAEVDTEPNSTDDVPVRFVPVIVMKPPPARVSVDGVTDVIVGAGGCVYVNAFM